MLGNSGFRVNANSPFQRKCRNGSGSGNDHEAWWSSGRLGRHFQKEGISSNSLGGTGDLWPQGKKMFAGVSR